MVRRSPPTILRDWIVRRRTTGVVRAAFTLVAVTADITAIMLSALTVSLVYQHLVYADGAGTGLVAGLGALLATVFVIINVARDDYTVADYLTIGGQARRTLFVWNMSFLAMLTAIFVARVSDDVSRGCLILVYFAGFGVLVLVRASLVAEVRKLAASGAISSLRIVVVGAEADVRAFTERHQPWTAGVDVAAAAVLRGHETLQEDLALAAAAARVLRPDDIYILVPWTDGATIDAAIDAFSKVPAAIHLGAQPVLDRFTQARVSRLGGIASLHLVRAPLTLLERLAKRILDLVIGTTMLVMLAPLLVLVAIAIKLDSAGPVFFVQRRYGFNQETFHILKFRSMTVREDDRHLSQARRGDPRITRIGRYLRRYNIDELPQLLNVVRGEMSLVGPRPHALAHNQEFERTVADYARRHNVKPGITGWAQIHGLRGEISSPETIHLRVEHDLYYIDNWTFGLDLRILAATLTRRGFENAY